MAIISKKRIAPGLKKEMRRKAGSREKTLMTTSNLVYTSDRGRCINFMNTRTGNSCQYDKKYNRFTN